MTTSIGAAVARLTAAARASVVHECSSGSGGVVVADLSAPPSPALAAATTGARKLLAGPIRYTTAGGDEVILRPDPVTATASVRAEAASRAAALERLLDPAPAEVARRWLLSLAALLERTPPAEELDAKVRAIVGVLDLPQCCYTPESLRVAGKAIRWFPGLATIVATLEPFAAPLRADLANLRAVAAAPDPVPRLPPPDGPRPKTDEEIAHVRAAAEAFRAEHAPPPRPRPTPRPLSPEQLAAIRSTYRKSGTAT